MVELLFVVLGVGGGYGWYMGGRSGEEKKEDEGKGLWGD